MIDQGHIDKPGRLNAKLKAGVSTEGSDDPLTATQLAAATSPCCIAVPNRPVAEPGRPAWTRAAG